MIEQKDRTTRDFAAEGEARREAIITFIRSYQADHGYPPSIREVADGVGVTKNAVSHHLSRLADEGRVSQTPGKYRSLRVTNGA